MRLWEDVAVNVRCRTNLGMAQCVTHNWYKGQMVRASMLRAGIAVLIAAAVVPLFYAPWSIVWLSNQAYHAHRDQHYTEALAYYDRVIERNPQDVWAFVNRSRVY
jgi:hypothetical protein